MTEHFTTTEVLDPLGDLDADAAQKASKNRAKVGSARPSSLLYTYGPGSVMDLPHFTVMPAGTDDWERIWARRSSIPTVHAPRLLDAVRRFPGQWTVQELRPFPWAPKESIFSKEGDDLGVPARVFPQWLRCTGCDLLGRLDRFAYVNTNPYRPDQARFEHPNCPGRKGQGKSKVPRQAVPARYLLACPDGHLDEFPYDWWVHQGASCPAGVEFAPLTMDERTVGKGASASIRCGACSATRPMNEAQGEAGRAKLPGCRGRHPHLGAFDKRGCKNGTRFMLLGASNLWFPATQAIVVMPEAEAATQETLGVQLLAEAGKKRVEKYHDRLDDLREYLEDEESDLAAWSDETLALAVEQALAPEPTLEEQTEALRDWDPTDLLVPEWNYLQKDPLGPQHEGDAKSGLALTKKAVHEELKARHVSRVLAVDRLRKVNAVVGFTRIDEMERANDMPARIVPLSRSGRPTWAIATEDRGEGVYLQFDESAVAAWEKRIYDTPLWEAHRQSHERNYNARYSETSKDVAPDSRMAPPRYWLLHTLSHVLLREMAMYSGYSAASLSERIYAWEGREGRGPSAGLLIVTTASDSDGTLGGLVQLSDPEQLWRVAHRALERAVRCSSDPVCAQRTPKDPEDFLHGAACHTCAMASETSCEKANRFLDRRFLVDLPGAQGLGFFR
ncbi:DrmB family protein [Oerskovia merdavium]|uniref:DrmB family protein n=1 Tax=Oerskovia merdavium TaxID=2762227 RepID=UPI00296AA230|nr:DrmB family protein [Oerskovia merdavium]